MPAIRNSADLINNFNEILEFCQNYREPVFLTNNGQRELAVMSIETYEELAGKMELYKLIQEGIDDIENGKILTEKEVLKNMETALSK